MSRAGGETLARWRQVGKWWEGENPIEFVRYLDSKGIRREVQKQLPILSDPTKLKPKKYVQTYNEDYSLRPNKRRDETVGKACGYVKETSFITNKLSPKSTYVPLHLLSGYSIGRSILLANEIPRLAAVAGLPAVALVDRFSMTGVVELYRECKKQGIKALIGASVELEQGGELVLIAQNKDGYTSLSRLLTACHLEEPRLFPLCTWERLERHSEGLICLTGGNVGPLDKLLCKKDYSGADELLLRLKKIFGVGKVFLEVERAFLPWSLEVEKRLRELAERHSLRLVAGGAVTHRRPSHFPAQDVLVCSDTLALVEEVVGRKPRRHSTQFSTVFSPVRSMNAEGFFKTGEEMNKLFADAQDLLANTLLVADLCDPDVLPGPTNLPLITDNPDQALREATYDGMREWHRHITPRLQKRIDKELERIIRHGYSNHFLVAWDMCKWAESQNIQFSGRGSVVDAAVAYCLGFSRIDAFEHNLHFDRFLPADGTKQPDIDIDFEAKRRDDIRNYLIDKYGKEHVATVAAVGTFRSRGILRAVGKALSIPEPVIGYVAKKIHGGVSPETLYDAIQKRPELRDSGITRERFLWVFKLAENLRDVPMNMKAHSSGVVISETPIADTVPVMWSGSGDDQDGFLRIIQWDKRSAKHCYVKFDILCLRGQDVLSGTEERLRQSDPFFKVSKLSTDDPAIYAAMRSHQTVGIPQSASPAMTQAHARIKTNDIYDASLVQAGIRPGVGGAVKLNTLIARRHGEPYSFSHPDLEEIIGHTYGIVVFQEQIDQLLEKFCGLSGGEAEETREKIHEKRHQEYGESVRSGLLERTVAKGYSLSVANEVLDLIVSFKGYGFAQGHALAFAEISARSVYCQQNYPADYFAALLDAQPAGYYGPATLANEARIRGLKVLPVDVNISENRVQVESILSQDPTLSIPKGGIRLDLGLIHGLSRTVRERIVTANRPFSSYFDFVKQIRPKSDELENLILCGALDSLYANRRAMLWGMESAFQYVRGEIFDPQALPMLQPEPSLPSDIEDFSFAEKRLAERGVLGLDIDQHLLAYERERIRARGGITAVEARALPHESKAFIVGNPIRLRFPPTPTGKRVVFFDLEDETGLMNMTCFDDVYQTFGHAIVLSQYVTVKGYVQRRNDFPAFIATSVVPYCPLLLAESVTRRGNLKTADFLVG
ncbi:MAG: DNA polymerase III subunit alpha [Fimbriimonadaceae bacterium]|nr:DNA polymerase III subunit alpha [Fimbriimonadaceae bacterium]